jgi:hypothetical protein
VERIVGATLLLMEKAEQQHAWERVARAAARRKQVIFMVDR